MTTPDTTPKTQKSSARRIQVRQSGVHGKGVFALQDIPKGETVIEYDTVIDALHGGNSARWINHSCSPNCKPVIEDARVFIKAKRNIIAGEELNYDYGLIIDEPVTKKLIAQYPCWCGSPRCRKTLLAAKPLSKKKTKKLKVQKIRHQLQKLKAKLARLQK
jgi:SET domain-containing protein